MLEDDMRKTPLRDLQITNIPPVLSDLKIAAQSERAEAKTYCCCSNGKSEMSRREDRDSDPKRRRSRFDREPSPKRSRRDGKSMTGREPSDRNAGPREHVEQDEKHRRRLQDPLPLEAPPSTNAKVDSEPTSKESPKKGHGNSEGTKPSSGPTEVPRSRSYFQHDERNIAGSGGRSSSRRSTSDRGWWKDTRDQHVKASDRTMTNDSRRDDGSRRGDDDASVWRHDGFYEMEANPNPPHPPPALGARKRPAFREQKVPTEAQDVHKSKTEAVGPTSTGYSNERKEGRSRYSNHRERPERTFARDSARPNRREDLREGFVPRERFGGGNKNRGRDTSNGRQGYSRSGNNDVRIEKWKHDLFDEANRSPSPKNEEDRIAKIEALLAS
ncbi:pre-mRNA-splicing factor ATP-dependent RNA helicase PRP16 [Punica granatum]|uniref:Uncharacterized protein n=2 Tax=Punica granatum TaxID=22663 RepID=A0A218VWD2_PUNGR|nr:pre-mRNA-splicing factor ATP-dependent RNA helicase PRP16 [Punica granatum]OWM64785.1 hypothetical protein CDL15_Pgr028502 [Punica granatum]PKI71631.1 hypothetical protein CRG98_007954 [Punica granatum]